MARPRADVSWSAALAAAAGVQGIVEVRASPQLQIQGFPAAVVSCAQLVTTPGLGRCPAGAAAVKVPASLTYIGRGNLAESTWPAADFSPRRLDSLPLASLCVATNGSQPAIEQARTAAAAHHRPGNRQKRMTRALLVLAVLAWPGATHGGPGWPPTGTFMSRPRARMVRRGSGMVFNRWWLWSKFVTCTCACGLLTTGAASTRPGFAWQAGGRDNPGCTHVPPE